MVEVIEGVMMPVITVVMVAMVVIVMVVVIEGAHDGRDPFISW